MTAPAEQNNITLIQSTSPTQVCKRYTQGPDGLHKAAVASVTEGMCRTRAVPDAAALRDILAEVTDRQDLVICPGAFAGAGDDPFKLVPEAVLAERLGRPIGDEVLGGVHAINGERIAARLKRGITPSAWLLLDADNPPGIPAAWAALSLAERLALLEALMPGISRCERVELRGSSARVHNGAGPAGATHAWIRVSDPARIAILKAHVGIRMVTEGLSFTSPRYSRTEPGKVVGQAQRTLIDLAVWDTGRLVFVAKPDVQAPGYSVAEAGLQIVNAGGGALDLPFARMPDAAALRDYERRAGHRVDVSERNGAVAVRIFGELTLDTEIERRGEVKPLRAWTEGMKPGDRLRCETPFRASVSEAAFIKVQETGSPMLHDVGSGTSYYLAKPKAPAIRIVTAAELLTMQVPAREYALAPVLPLPGLAMAYAPRGMGKTYVALSIGYGVACGGPVLRWRAPEPRRVLYADGEMPAGALQERLAQIAAGAGIQPPSPDYLRFACSDLMPEGLPNLADAAAQDALEAAMGDAEVLILDNLSTLAHGLRENEADDWGGVQRWLLALRRRGKHVLLIHHAGKGGAQRGTSRREDVLDTVIALRRPADYEPVQGARFEVHLEKARGIAGSEAGAFEAVLTPAPTGGLSWAISDLADAQRERAERLLEDGMSVRDVAEETGMSKSAVHRLKKQVKADAARAGNFDA